MRSVNPTNVSKNRSLEGVRVTNKGGKSRERSANGPNRCPARSTIRARDLGELLPVSYLDGSPCPIKFRRDRGPQRPYLAC